MSQEIIFAGMGGQGVLFMGTLLANAAVSEGKEVVWRPSFKGIMRGAVSNCIVNISDQPISSPIVAQYDILIALTGAALKTFESQVREGGILLYESTKIKEPPTRDDIRIIGLPAYKKAGDDLNNIKVMNMIMLGGLHKSISIVQKESVFAALEQELSGKDPALLSLNKKALEIGMGLVERSP